jgi:hypothetical protein
MASFFLVERLAAALAPVYWTSGYFFYLSLLHDEKIVCFDPVV